MHPWSHPFEEEACVKSTQVTWTELLCIASADPPGFYTLAPVMATLGPETLKVHDNNVRQLLRGEDNNVRRLLRGEVLTLLFWGVRDAGAVLPNVLRLWNPREPEKDTSQTFGIVAADGVLHRLIRPEDLLDSELRRRLLERLLSVPNLILKSDVTRQFQLRLPETLREGCFRRAMEESKVSWDEVPSMDRVDLPSWLWHVVRSLVWLRRHGCCRPLALPPILTQLLAAEWTLNAQMRALRILHRKQPDSPLAMLPSDVFNHVLEPFIRSPPFDEGFFIPGLSSLEVKIFFPKI